MGVFNRELTSKKVAEIRNQYNKVNDLLDELEEMFVFENMDEYRIYFIIEYGEIILKSRSYKGIFFREMKLEKAFKLMEKYGCINPRDFE
jgi:hypothetical protein